MASSSTGTSCPESRPDALVEASHPGRMEDTEETQVHEDIDAPPSKQIKLSVRGCEILAALSGRRISITAIEFGNESAQDGGTFADVAKATLIVSSSGEQGPRKVAVKKLRLISGMTEEKLFDAFVNEFRILDKLSHPNVVEIIGFVEDMERRIAWLVFPWEDHGNLRQFLRSGTWELPERVSLIDDVALGLEYLHTRKPPICHGDLKSLNVLVNSSHLAVITDFGSARIMGPGTTSESQQTASASGIPSKQNGSAEIRLSVSNGTFTLTGPACSARWAPPEHFNGNPLVLASDIWALGWIAWETITDSFPFEEVESEAGVTIRVLEGQLPTIYDQHQLSQIHQLCQVMQKCWKPDPMERPSSTECRKAINWIPMAIPSAKNGDQSEGSSAALLSRIGEIHRLQGRNEEALKVFEQALVIARSTWDEAILASLLWQTAEVHRIGGRHVEAEASYSEALAICNSIGNDWGRANALKGLGDVRSAQSKYVEAEASCTEALAIYKSIGSDLGRANALKGLGKIREAQSKYVEAEASYTEALAIYKSIGADLSRANALNGLGHVRRAQSKYVEAEASYAEALAIYKSIGADLGRANALKGLGHVLRAQSKYIEAEASYAEALAIYKSIGDDLGRADALKGLGDVRRAQSKYVEAEASYTEALAIYKSIGDDQGRSNTLNRLGYVRRVQSKYVEAEASYTEALAIYKSTKDNLGRVSCSLGLAEIWIKQARYAEAKALVGDVASISQRRDYAWGIHTSNRLLNKILAVQGLLNAPLTPTVPLPGTDDASATSP